MEDFGKRIEINISVMAGKPVIKGTRISVESIVEELGSGYSLQDVLQAHPRLQKRRCACSIAVCFSDNEE